MKSFTPKKVPNDAWKLWASTGWVLMERRFFFLFFITLMFYVFTKLVNNFYLSFLVMSLTSFIFLLSARAADDGSSLIDEINKITIRSWATSFYALLMPLAAIIFIIYITKQYGGAGSDHTTSHASTLVSPYLTVFKNNKTLFLIWVNILFIHMAMCLTLFFTIPLILFQNLTYRQAFLQAFLSWIKNYIPVSVFLVLLYVMALAGPFMLVLILILFPVFSTMLYTAYRHIWFGEIKNKKLVIQNSHNRLKTIHLPSAV